MISEFFFVILASDCSCWVCPFLGELSIFPLALKQGIWLIKTIKMSSASTRTNWCHDRRRHDSGQSSRQTWWTGGITPAAATFSTVILFFNLFTIAIMIESQRRLHRLYGHRSNPDLRSTVLYKMNAFYGPFTALWMIWLLLNACCSGQQP